MRPQDEEFLRKCGPWDHSVASVSLFALRLEKEWRRRMMESVDYLSEREDLLRLDFDSQLLGLDLILFRLEEAEEYERCRVVLDLRDELAKEADLLVSIVARGDWTTSEL
jgi:hypothetical protein